MLKVKKLRKTFGDIIALPDVSFDVGKGEFVFITGRSGAGKTTLLRLILREMLPDSGDIIFDGKNIFNLKKNEIPHLRQNIGVVFQDFKVLPERTVRENVEVALAVIGTDTKEWASRVDQVLELTGLGERSELFPLQLSGGELQRVSLARALVVNPKIVLADEPTGNLDWETADEIVDLLKKINKEGKTVIMATHHQMIVDKLGERVIELKGRGTAKKEGTEKKKEKTAKKKEKPDSKEKKK